MAAKKGLDVNRRVGIAMSVLSPAEREAVGRLIQSHRDFERYAARPGKVQRLATSDPLYTLRVTPQIRLVFKRADAGIEVLDLVEQATLDRFAKRGGKRANGRGPEKAEVGEPGDPAGR